MTLCIAGAGQVLALAVSQFTLGWTHSVEHIRWTEHWEISAEGLRPTLAILKGTGAGMEIPEGAEHIDGAWHFRPDIPPQKTVFLAASGATGGGWELCTAGHCHILGATAAAPIRLSAAAPCPPT